MIEHAEGLQLHLSTKSRTATSVSTLSRRLGSIVINTGAYGLGASQRQWKQQWRMLGAHLQANPPLQKNQRTMSHLMVIFVDR